MLTVTKSFSRAETPPPPPAARGLVFPCGLPVVSVVWRGAPITGHPARWVQQEALAEAGRRAALRRRQGAVQRAAPSLARPLLDLRLHRSCEVPEGVPARRLEPAEVREGTFSLMRIIWKLRHYVGGSHTWRLHQDAEYFQRAEQVLAHLHPPLLPR